MQFLVHFDSALGNILQRCIQKNAWCVFSGYLDGAYCRWHGLVLLLVRQLSLNTFVLYPDGNVSQFNVAIFSISLKILIERRRVLGCPASYNLMIHLCSRPGQGKDWFWFVQQASTFGTWWSLLFSMLHLSMNAEVVFARVAWPLPRTEYNQQLFLFRIPPHSPFHKWDYDSELGTNALKYNVLV